MNDVKQHGEANIGHGGCRVGSWRGRINNGCAFVLYRVAGAGSPNVTKLFLSFVPVRVDTFSNHP